MAVTEQSRHAMVEALIERLGEEVAMTLVEHLPPAGWADVATRRDLEVLRNELRGEMAALRGEVAELRGELRGEIGGLRAELHQGLRDVQRNLLFGFVAALTANTALFVAALQLIDG